MNHVEILEEIESQIAICTRCKLHHSRKKAVPGAGNPNAEVMLIGEGPGFHENQQGLPFVGASGKFLDELLDQAKLTREEVFITNVVKCRPPGNRDPQTEELEACKAYLERQIEAINPDVIVTLGRFSMAHFLNLGKISSIHGRSQWCSGRMVIPMYHPAAALHQPSLRSVVKEDFSKIPDLVREAKKTRKANPDLTSLGKQELEVKSPNENGNEQLKLF